MPRAPEPGDECRPGGRCPTCNCPTFYCWVCKQVEVPSEGDACEECSEEIRRDDEADRDLNAERERTT